MCKLHLQEPITIEKDGKEILLNLPVYNVSDEKLMKANGLFKCFSCGDFFDHAWQFNWPTKHHREHWNDREFCKTCYDAAWARLKD